MIADAQQAGLIVSGDPDRPPRHSRPCMAWRSWQPTTCWARHPRTKQRRQRSRSSGEVWRQVAALRCTQRATP